MPCQSHAYCFDIPVEYLYISLRVPIIPQETGKANKNVSD